MAMLPTRRNSGRNVTLVNPSHEFEDIYERMGQLMNMAFGSLGPAAIPDLPWAPAADVSENDDAYTVRVELAGVQRDQIDLQLQDRELIISGEIPEPQQDEKERRHRSSRRTGRFEYRTFLPGDVNPDGVRAELHDGVLTVTIPTSEVAKPRKIEITGD
jgi:HSP20 family protein